MLNLNIRKPKRNLGPLPVFAADYRKLWCRQADQMKMINDSASVLTELYLKSCLLLWVSAYGL